MDPNKVRSSRAWAVTLQQDLLQVQASLSRMEEAAPDLWEFTHRNASTAVALYTEIEIAREKLNEIAAVLKHQLDHLGDVRVPEH
jgi:hypothetical protein